VFKRSNLAGMRRFYAGDESWSATSTVRQHAASCARAVQRGRRRFDDDEHVNVQRERYAIV